MKKKIAFLTQAYLTIETLSLPQITFSVTLLFITLTLPYEDLTIAQLIVDRQSEQIHTIARKQTLPRNRKSNPVFILKLIYSLLSILIKIILMIQINIQDSKRNAIFTLLFDIGQNATIHIEWTNISISKPQQYPSTQHHNQ